MYILLFSIVISAIILGVYQYIDSVNRDNNTDPYDVSKDLFTVNNMMAYVLIATTVFFVMYMAFNDDLDIFSSLGIMENDNTSNEIKKINVNPSVLRNTTDPMKMGFEPYNSDGGGSGGSGGSGGNGDGGSDASSVSSSECSVDSE